MREFNNNIKKEFFNLKNPSNHQELNSMCISLEGGGFLQPIGKLHADNESLITHLKDWRNSALYAYYKSPEASIESTKKWLNQVLIASESKVLFLIYNKKTELIGHIGLAFHEEQILPRAVELDNLLRDPLTKSDGSFSNAIITLQRWARNTLLAENIFLRVLSSNLKAFDFYRNREFIEFKSESLEDNLSWKYLKKPSINEWQPGEMILTAGPTIGSNEKKYVADAVINGWNNQWNKYLNEFESEFAKYVGCKYALATSSCSGALHIALKSLGLEKDDEVIVPDITWVASANAVLWAGATPVFADVSPITWDLDPDSVVSKINTKTKAIIPVHLYGNPCKMDQIMEIAKRFNLRVVEDAAPAIGALYNGNKVGSYGDFSAFSFQGAKLTVTGEGGMLCTNDEELYKKAYRIWDQGRIPGTFWIEELGVKYKMSNVLAALGLGQLERTNLMIEKKRVINKIYRERLKNLKEIYVWSENENSFGIYWMTCIQLTPESPINRDHLCQQLKEKGIDTRPVFPSISQYPYWPKKQEAQPNSVKIAETAINLPSGVTLTANQIHYICDQIIGILKESIGNTNI